MSKVLAAERIKRSVHTTCNKMAIHCVKSIVTLPPVIPTWRLTFYVALRQTPFEFIPEKWRYKPAILVSQDGCTCAPLITEILMNPLFWSCQVVKWKSFNALFPSYWPFYDGAAGFAAVPVNFFSVSEDDKALTQGGWGMRKRDENSGKIKETLEKKECAGKNSLQA